MRATTDDPLSFISSIVARRRRDDDPEKVAQLIIDRLAMAGYDIRAKPEMIPIRPNLSVRCSVPLGGPKAAGEAAVLGLAVKLRSGREVDFRCRVEPHDVAGLAERGRLRFVSELLRIGGRGRCD